MPQANQANGPRICCEEMCARSILHCQCLQLDLDQLLVMGSSWDLRVTFVAADNNQGDSPGGGKLDGNGKSWWGCLTIKIITLTGLLEDSTLLEH